MAESAALVLASSDTGAGVMLDLTEQDRPPATTDMPLLLLREAASHLSCYNAADVSGVLMAAVGPTELRAAEQPLAALDAYLSKDQHCEATVALLQDAPARLTLLCLVSSAVRLHPPVTAPSANVASLVLSIAQKMLNTISCHCVSLSALDFTAKLLRTQALQGAARQLAALTEPLGLQAEAAAAFQAGGDEVPQPRLQAPAAAGLPRQTTHLALQLLHFIYTAVTAVCCQLAMRDDWEAGEWETRTQALGKDLADALAGGYVLEHGARALLLLAPAVVRDTASEELLQRVLGRLSFMHFRLSSLLREGVSGELQGADRLRQALGGPSMQHAMMVMGLAAVGAAGGGCTYGLPQPLLHGLTLGLLTEHFPAASSVSEGGGGFLGLVPEPEPVRLMEHRWLWKLLGLLSSQARAALMGRRTALTLVLQVGHLMVLQTELHAAYSSAAGGGGGHRSGDGSVMHPVLNARAAAFVLVSALKVARSLCRAATGSARRRGSGEEAVAWWSLALSAARHAVWRMINGDMEEYITSLVSALTSGAELDAGLCQLPLDPPLDVAAALAVGFLPFLEGLLRRAACTGNAYDADLARRLLLRKPVEHTRRLLLPLLAYGEVREAAALLATVAKVVRQTAPDWAECLEAVHVTSRIGLEAAVAILPAAALQPPATQPDALANGVFGQGGSSNSVAAAAASPASQRLTAMLAFAACKVLPALAWVWRREVQHTEHMRGSLPEPEAAPPQVLAKKRGLVGRLATVLEPLLDWVLLLAVRCLRDGCGHGAGGCGVAEDASPSQAAGGAAATADAAAKDRNAGAGPGAAAAEAGGEWRRLLLEEVGAEQLLGAALGLAPHLAEEGVPHPRISQLLERLTACCIAVTLVVEEAGSAGAAAGAALTRPTWDPQLFRSLSLSILMSSGCQTTAEDALTLTLHLKNPAIPVSLREDCVPAQIAALAASLPAQAQARILLRTCANRDCANLEGDTEAELALLSCAVCGEVGYCSRACQVAHWRAGHKEACRARRPGGQGAAV